MDYQVLSDDDLVRECGENPCLEAWEEFIRRFHRTIASVALRACREWSQALPDVVEDRVQDALAKLCADNYSMLRMFHPHHPGAFRGYLRKITANVVYDHFRAEHAAKRDVANTTELNDSIHQLDCELGFTSSRDFEIFLNEIDDLLLQRGNGPIEKRDRAIFWLHYRYGMTAKEIASIPSLKLGEKGVESVIHRLMREIKEALVSKD